MEIHRMRIQNNIPNKTIHSLRLIEKDTMPGIIKQVIRDAITCTKRTNLGTIVAGRTIPRDDIKASLFHYLLVVHFLVFFVASTF